jgi:prefoldin subunit 5
MTTSSNTEIQQLKEFIDNRFNQLDRKIDETKSELKLEITEVKSELKQEIVQIKADIKGIDKRLSTVETSIQKIPDLAEKVGEFKNW